MKLPFYCVAVIAMCLLFACGSNNTLRETTDTPVPMAEDKSATLDLQSNVVAPPIQEERKAKANGYSTTTADTATTPPSTILQSGGPDNDWDKKIIKTARVTLELKAYSPFNTSIHE